MPTSAPVRVSVPRCPGFDEVLSSAAIVSAVAVTSCDSRSTTFASRASPKSTDARAPFLVEQDVLRFEVAVHEPGGVRRHQAAPGGEEDV